MNNLIKTHSIYSTQLNMLYAKVTIQIFYTLLKKFEFYKSILNKFYLK